jgi:hypothetical protein
MWRSVRKRENKRSQKQIGNRVNFVTQTKFESVSCVPGEQNVDRKHYKRPTGEHSVQDFEVFLKYNPHQKHPKPWSKRYREQSKYQAFSMSRHVK